MFEETSNGIKILVEPSYVEDQSKPEQSLYLFAYKVRIENKGRNTVQLKSRHWIITDANGQVEEVEGPGVVGQQPTLGPGEAFEYESFCPLTTPTGSMQGSYFMTDKDGEELKVKIPYFVLAEPGHYH